MRAFFYFIIFGLAVWILGFIASYVLLHLIDYNILLIHPLSYLGLILFFVFYLFLINVLFKYLHIDKSIKNLALVGTLAFVINLTLDIIIIFPFYIKISVFSFIITYIGYALILLSPLLLYFVGDRRL